MKKIEIVQTHDFIVVFDAIEKEICQEICELFDRDDSKWEGKNISLKGETRVNQDKVSYDLEIRPEGAWKPLHEKIHRPILECIGSYVEASPALKTVELVGSNYKIQMYPENEGHFDWHADALGHGALERVFALVLYLNDVEKGGETEFYHQKIKVRPQAGQLVLFPTAWNYMHRGLVPESGAKYIISSFVSIKS